MIHGRTVLIAHQRSFVVFYQIDKHQVRWLFPWCSCGSMSGILPFAWARVPIRCSCYQHGSVRNCRETPPPTFPVVGYGLILDFSISVVGLGQSTALSRGTTRSMAAYSSGQLAGGWT